jgi:uncharacterized membrane protein
MFETFLPLFLMAFVKMLAYIFAFVVASCCVVVICLAISGVLDLFIVAFKKKPKKRGDSK